MKWFKHITDSLDDPFIQDLMDEFGSDGYLVFFGILEMMGREFDPKSPGKVTLPRRFCRRKLRLSWQKISTILEFCEQNNRFFVEDNGRQVTINCPKLKDLTDNWTKRLLRSSSEVTPKKVSNQLEVEEEVDIKKRKKEKKVQTKIPHFINPLTWEAFLHMRTKIKKPATPQAQKLIISYLTVRKDNHDPNALLNECIINSWQHPKWIVERQEKSQHQSQDFHRNAGICSKCNQPADFLLSGLCHSCT